MIDDGNYRNQPVNPRDKYSIVWVFILLMVCAGVLGGCGPTTAPPDEGEKHIEALDPWMYKDRATGCEYLSTRSEAGLWPRIAADGKTHMGCKAVQ